MISLKVKYLESLKDKSIGLIGKKTPTPVFFKTHFGIHTFFMSFPIDILILNKNNSVVFLKENLLPNRLFFWNPVYENVVELPQGTIKKLKIKKTQLVKICYI